MTGNATDIVNRRMKYGEEILEPGQLVDTTDWPWRDKCRANRWITQLDRSSVQTIAPGQEVVITASEPLRGKE